MTLTIAQQEALYDAARLSPIADAESIYEQQVADVARRIGKILCETERDETLYPTPIPLSAQEEKILTLLLEISEPDPDELPPTMPANPSPLLVDLLDWAKKESDAEYAKRFALGYQHGQAIARALIAEEQGEDIDEIIRMLEEAEGGK